MTRSFDVGRVRAVPRTRRVRARPARPGTTAFGRPDMDAFFQHRDGSFLGGWNQPLGSRVTQQTSYSYIVTNYRSTNLIADPPYTPQFGDLVAAFPSSDFLYDSETDSIGITSSTAPMPMMARNQTLTAAFALRRRARRADQSPLDGRAAAARAQQHRHDRAVRSDGERASVVGGIRFENNGSFGFYAAPRAGRVVARQLGQRRRSAPRAFARSVGRGIKEPLFIQSYSPSPSFLGNPDLKPERSRGFDVGIEQRFARRSRRASKRPTSRTTSTI